MAPKFFARKAYKRVPTTSDSGSADQMQPTQPPRKLPAWQRALKSIKGCWMPSFKEDFAAMPAPSKSEPQPTVAMTEQAPEVPRTWAEMRADAEGGESQLQMERLVLRHTSVLHTCVELRAQREEAESKLLVARLVHTVFDNVKTAAYAEDMRAQREEAESRLLVARLVSTVFSNVKQATHAREMRARRESHLVVARLVHTVFDNVKRAAHAEEITDLQGKLMSTCLAASAVATARAQESVHAERRLEQEKARVVKAETAQAKAAEECTSAQEALKGVQSELAQMTRQYEDMRKSMEQWRERECAGHNKATEWQCKYNNLKYQLTDTQTEVHNLRDQLRGTQARHAATQALFKAAALQATAAAVADAESRLRAAHQQQMQEVQSTEAQLRGQVAALSAEVATLKQAAAAAARPAPAFPLLSHNDMPKRCSHGGLNDATSPYTRRGRLSRKTADDVMCQLSPRRAMVWGVEKTQGT